MHQHQPIQLTPRIQSFLESSHFRRTVSTNCDYYDHLDSVRTFAVSTQGVHSKGDWLQWLQNASNQEQSK